MSSFFEFQANGNKDAEENRQPQEAVVQDQDTVIGDAMVETSQLFYETAREIAACISENCQETIDCEKIRRAAIALAYMEGVDFGLAMDDKIEKWYLLEMKKSMSTILESQRNAFQTQIYVPIAPWQVMNYDQFKCEGKTMFIHALSNRQPQQKWIDDAKKEIMKDARLKRHLQAMAEKEYSDLFDVFPELDRPPPKKAIEEEVELPASEIAVIVDVEDKAVKKGDRHFLSAEELEKRAKQADESENVVSDDSQSVMNLRNLFRQNKIDKSQYIGGLATLVATGLISKSEFTRLKAASN